MTLLDVTTPKIFHKIVKKRRFCSQIIEIIDKDIRGKFGTQTYVTISRKNVISQERYADFKFHMRVVINTETTGPRRAASSCNALQLPRFLDRRPDVCQKASSFAVDFV